MRKSSPHPVLLGAVLPANCPHAYTLRPRLYSCHNSCPEHTLLTNRNMGGKSHLGPNLSAYARHLKQGALIP